MKKKIMIFSMLLVAIIGLTGCTSANTVKHNISREADEFKVKRRITFVNLRTGEYLFTMTGKCSIKGGSGDVNSELEVICRIGENKYQKHMLYLAEETTYVVEQLEDIDVSRYDYEFIFRPEAIIPIEIKTQIGEN